MAHEPPVYTVPPGVPFVDALAAGLLVEAGFDPAAEGGDRLALARCMVLLPTRRACRSLAEAFLRMSGGRPLILPRMQPVGDVDEETLAFEAGNVERESPVGEAALDLPPAIAPARRLLLLARLVMARPEQPDPEQAAWLAHELAALLDRAQTEEVSFDRLADLAPEKFAAHWQITLDFLKVLTREWPKLLQAENATDPAARRTALIDAQTALWRAAPPADPVIAAGSTGSVPATARLLGVVAGLPAGRVVLSGLDRDLDAESWDALDPTHPQYGLKQLLERLGVSRDAVADWPWTGGRADTPAVRALPARMALLREAMRPAPASGRWRDAAIEETALRETLGHVTRIDCPGPREEAGVAALCLREALEPPGEDGVPRTAALVTPDRGLARRVAAELARWGIAIDDSAGRPLAATPPGSFLRLTARMVTEELAPVPLLAALKHPFAAAGGDRMRFRRSVRRLERAVLRGPRPTPGFDGLRAALGALDERAGRHLGDTRDIARLLDRLEATAGDFAALVARGAPLGDLVRAHVRFAEALAATDHEPGGGRLWAGDAGEKAASFVAEALAAHDGFPEVEGRHYPGLLEAMMAGIAVRPSYGLHPRLHIWGPLEARLQHADIIVLGGLNEGTWPIETEGDPWMSRQMRAAFGLPALERRIGLSAHDFATLFCAPEVVMTRATRVEGTPTVPSRWLLRLDAVLGGIAERTADEHPPRLHPTGQWLAWLRALDAPAGKPEPVPPPAPCPPVHVRPRKLSVTRIERWKQDPYAIYARYILGLEALDEIDADPGAADYGNAIHDALDRFCREWPDALPDDARARLLSIGEECFAALGSRPGVLAFWWPRFLRVADWVLAVEAGRRPSIDRLLSEVRGEMTFKAPAGRFTVTAVADRIERREDGSLVLVDYKTGTVPEMTRIVDGMYPQLPLEAAIAMNGGFTGLPGPDPVSEMAFWRLTGGNPPGEIKPVKKSRGIEPQELPGLALEGLKRMVAVFDRPETPYLARPRPRYAPRFSDYEHLARVKEWSTGGGEDEG